MSNCVLLFMCVFCRLCSLFVFCSAFCVSFVAYVEFCGLHFVSLGAMRFVVRIVL